MVVSSGVTAEKLMYERAVEMSRAAAVNELVGEDVAGCEIAYVTAIRMLEAILESDDEPAETDRDKTDKAINGMEVDDRQVIEKSEFPRLGIFYRSRTLTKQSVVTSMRARLTALRKKIVLAQKRRSLMGQSGTPLTVRGISPVSTTSPRG